MRTFDWASVSVRIQKKEMEGRAPEPELKAVTWANLSEEKLPDLAEKGYDISCAVIPLNSNSDWLDSRVAGHPTPQHSRSWSERLQLHPLAGHDLRVNAETERRHDLAVQNQTARPYSNCTRKSRPGRHRLTPMRHITWAQQWLIGIACRPWHAEGLIWKGRRAGQRNRSTFWWTVMRRRVRLEERSPPTSTARTHRIKRNERLVHARRELIIFTEANTWHHGDHTIIGSGATVMIAPTTQRLFAYCRVWSWNRLTSGDNMKIPRQEYCCIWLIWNSLIWNRMRTLFGIIIQIYKSAFYLKSCMVSELGASQDSPVPISVIFFIRTE